MIPQRSVYFVGIGGIGVSALATVLARRGVTVSGHDHTENEAVRRLWAAGVRVTVGSRTRVIPRGVDLVVHSPAVPPQHPTLREARRKKITIWSYPTALWHEVEDKKVVAIAGTHGKTTVTALTAWFLISAKLDPTVIVGSYMLNGNTNGRRGRGGYAVIEADEFNRSFFAYHPDIPVITNIEHDHFDTYPTMASVRQAFRQFVSQRRTQHNPVVINADDVEAARLLPQPGASFGLGQGMINPKNIVSTKTGTSFTIEGTRFVSPLFGVHNVANVAAAVAAATLCGVSISWCAQALRSFKGTWRRFEKVGTYHGMTVISDYGHHPTEITATLRAARQRYPDQQIIVVYQPHQHNRTKHLYKQFAHALSAADTAIITEIFAVTGRLKKAERAVTAHSIVAACTAPAVVWAPEEKNVKSALDGMTAPHGVILCLGAGTIDSYIRTLVRRKK